MRSSSLHRHSLCIFFFVLQPLKFFFLTQQSLQAKGLFIRYVSHEIRTPLNTVFLRLKLLQDDLALTATDKASSTDAERLETVRDIKDCCDIAISTLNEVLTFDKLESGAMMLERDRVGAMPFIEAAIKPFYVQVCVPSSTAL